jgi:hypothetical protein
MSNFGPAQFGPAVFGGEPVAHLYLQIDAEMTARARRLTALSHSNGWGLQVQTYQFGQGGFDPLDYFAALPVSPDDATLVDPQGVPAAIQHYEWCNERCVAYYCDVVSSGVTAGYLGEIGLYASLVYPPAVAVIAGPFLYAIGHFPMIAFSSVAPNDFNSVVRVTVQA